MVCFVKYCPFLFIVCFEIILSVCACKNLLGLQLLYTQFVVPDMCMLFNSYVLLKKEYVNFKLASLNVREFRSSTKRKALLTWLNERQYDIIFLQETYSTVDVEHIWKTQWNGKLYFSHGSNDSCRVMVFVRSDLDFNLISINSDDEGRSIVMEAEEQGSLYLFVNIYAPNKT